GYAFVFLGCVMLLQSVAMLSPGYKHIRGRALLIGALLLGFWTMPSFLYAALVPCGVLLFVLIRKKEWRSLVLYGIDLSGAGLLVVFAYSGILFLGDPHVLLHPEAWTDKFAFDENWLQDIFDYVRALYGGLLGIKSAVLLAISAI